MDKKVDPLARLALAAKVASERPDWIRAAREQGNTWEEIAAAARLSRAGVIKLSKQPSTK